MHSRKRTATQAQLPTAVNHFYKRPMYTQTLPSRRNAQGLLIDDAPEGHSLLNRWVSLVGDTFRVLWNRSADFASRIVPMDNTETIPEADIPLPPSPPPHSRFPFPTRPPIPHFNPPLPHSSGPVYTTTLNNSLSPPHPVASASSQGGSSQLDAPAAASPFNPDQLRLKYPKHNHIHLAQHKRKVEEHNKRELGRLRTRRTSLKDEMDMEKLLRVKTALISEQNAQLNMQWQMEKISANYQSNLDSFAGLQTYRQMVLDESAGNFHIPSSPSLPDLGKSLSGRSRSRSLANRRGSFNLERTLQIAHQSLNEPRPPLLSFDKLRISERERDREIDRRIREATRLPTELSPNIVQEIKLMRAKRGVVATFARESIKDLDMARLNPQGPDQWLNDEVINIYGALLLDRSEKYVANKKTLVNGTAKKGKGKVPEFLNIHYFNTYLYPKIPNYDTFRLNKWTKKIDIFSKEYVFIPINHGNVHWTLSAINFRKKRIEAYDSMGHYRPEVYKTLRSYLELEHKDKKNTSFDFTGWVDHFDENIPKQENGFDCGVFTCQFMESLSRGVDEFAFDQSDMVYIRNRMTWEIGKGRMWEASDG